MIVRYKEAFNRAMRYNNKLRADDERFNRIVSIYHEDGSHFLWEHAFLMRWDIKVSQKNFTNSWFFVFTEHFGFHVFACDEVTAFQYAKRMYKIERFAP
jgi:hypothetical protein